MKKLLILGLSFGMMVLTANAQSTNDVKFGIKAGGNLINGGKYTVGNAQYSTKWQPGFQAGVFVEIPLSTQFSFMPEVIYSQKGLEVEETVGNTTGRITSKVGYIDVPVLFAYNATPQLHFQLGPQASFLTNQSTKAYSNGTQIGETNTDKDDLRGAVAGGVIGVGYRFTPNINLNARYSMDFQSVAKEEVNQDKARFNGFALSLGYTF